MTRKEFYHLVYDEISRRLSDCYKKDEITIEKTYLNDGRPVMMLMFVKKGSLYAPGFNLDEYYEQYLIQVPREEYLSGIEKAARNHAAFAANTDGYKMDHFEDASDKIRIRLRSLEAREPSEGLHTIHHPLFLIQFKAEFKGENENSLLLPIHEKMVRNWGISDEELLAAAFKKQVKDGIILSPLDEARISEGFQLKINYWDNPPKAKEAREAGLLVLTNPSQYWGASLIINPDVLKRIYRILGVNFYILPSSIHEVMILADNGSFDAEKLSALIESINESEVGQQDVLSNEVFFYDAKEERLMSGREHDMRNKKMAIARTDQFLSSHFGFAGA